MAPMPSQWFQLDGVSAVHPAKHCVSVRKGELQPINRFRARNLSRDGQFTRIGHILGGGGHFCWRAARLHTRQRLLLLPPLNRRWRQCQANGSNVKVSLQSAQTSTASPSARASSSPSTGFELQPINSLLPPLNVKWLQCQANGSSVKVSLQSAQTSTASPSARASSSPPTGCEPRERGRRERRREKREREQKREERERESEREG